VKDNLVQIIGYGSQAFMERVLIQILTEPAILLIKEHATLIRVLKSLSPWQWINI
jgi:hypothetical protein